MTSPLDPLHDVLLGAMQAEARGPRRNGIFAVWLFARVAEGMLPPPTVTARTHRRRLEALERRISSLSIPPPLRRALKDGYGLLAEATPSGAALALRQLAAPARETVSAAVGGALTEAARAAGTMVHGGTAHERPAHRSRIAH